MDWDGEDFEEFDYDNENEAFATVLAWRTAKRLDFGALCDRFIDFMVPIDYTKLVVAQGEELVDSTGNVHFREGVVASLD